MNLRDFLAYRNNCLSCNAQLSIFFSTPRRKKYRIEDGRFLTYVDLKSIKRNQRSYKVGYSIGMDDNSLRVEFYDQEGDQKFYRDVPTWMLDRYKKFQKNSSDLKITKHCPDCRQYYYESDRLEFDYQNCKIEDLSLRSEWLRWSAPHDEKHKIYVVHNWYDTHISWVMTYKSESGDVNANHRDFHNPASIPLLSMNSMQDLKKRIDTVMPFF